MDRTTNRVSTPAGQTPTSLTSLAESDLLAPLLADFQLVGDGIDRLIASLAHRPGPTAA